MRQKVCIECSEQMPRYLNGIGGPLSDRSECWFNICAPGQSVKPRHPTYLATPASFPTTLELSLACSFLPLISLLDCQTIQAGLAAPKLPKPQADLIDIAAPPSVSCRRQDSQPRVQTVQAGQGPGGWTHRRGWNVPSVPSRSLARYGILYPISTKSLISKRNLQSPYIPILHWYHVQHQSFYLRYPYILILQYDIVLDIESKIRHWIHIKCTKSVEIEYRTQYRSFSFDIETISSVQRASFWSVVNIVPDIVPDIDVNI